MGVEYHECWGDETAVVRASSRGGWHVITEPTRATHCRRRHDPADRRWRTHRCDVPPHHRPPFADEVERAADLLCDMADGISADVASPQETAGVHLRIHLQRRSYHNSEGLSRTSVRTHWTVTVQGPAGGTVTAVPADRSHIPHLLAELRDELLTATAQAARVDSVAARTSIVLTPAAAGILLHELIGHALEERDLRPGDTVGPDTLRVVAATPADGGWDDEGVPSHDIMVVDRGRVRTTVLDRLTADILGGQAGGHAQRVAHGGSPRVRLTHLQAEAANGVHDSVPARHIHCSAVRGGRYWHGAAVLEVAQAVLVNDGTRTVPVAPFRLRVSHRDLREGMTLLHHRGETGPGRVVRGGVCVKNGEALASFVRSPAVALTQFQYWPAR